MGVGRAFGTFGELLQGCLLEDNTDFLVTLPIDCYSYAIFVLDPTLPDVSVFPPEKQKSQLLTCLILAHYGLPAGGRLILQSELPVGKGLASSSADLVAAAKAVSSYYHLQLESALLARLMCQIEPSDGVMYPGATVFYHRRGVLHAFLGSLPALTIVGIDEGGEVDTIQFNRIPKLFSDVEKKEYHQLLIALSSAIRQQDRRTIGHIATRSAVLNQKLNPKRTLDEVMALCQEVQGLGVVAAHSGTCLGILLATDEPGYQDCLQQAQAKLAHLGASVQVYHSFHGCGG